MRLNKILKQEVITKKELLHKVLIEYGTHCLRCKKIEQGTSVLAKKRGAWKKLRNRRKLRKFLSTPN